MFFFFLIKVGNTRAVFNSLCVMYFTSYLILVSNLKIEIRLFFFICTQAFIHLSTAFCHCEYETLEEIIYPAAVSPRDVIQMVQWIDETTLEIITPRYFIPFSDEMRTTALLFFL